MVSPDEALVTALWMVVLSQPLEQTEYTVPINPHAFTAGIMQKIVITITRLRLDFLKYMQPPDGDPIWMF
jgi:hypothetical protein